MRVMARLLSMACRSLYCCPERCVQSNGLTRQAMWFELCRVLLLALGGILCIDNSIALGVSPWSPSEWRDGCRIVAEERETVRERARPESERALRELINDDIIHDPCNRAGTRSTDSRFRQHRALFSLTRTHPHKSSISSVSVFEVPMSSHRCPRHVHVFRCKLSREAARLSEDRRYKEQIEHT